MCSKEQGYYQSQEKVSPPKYCAANKDGECYHKGCPQIKNWQPICPVPGLERE